MAGEVQVAGHDVAREPDAVRARHRRHRPVLGSRQALHRRGEPPADGRSATPRQGRGPSTGRRAARALRPGRGGQEAGRDLLRRHDAAARPGDDPHRRPADHLPRRADGGPRSAQPPRHVADRPRPRRGRRDDLPDDAGPRRGGPARASDRRPRPRGPRRGRDAGRAEATGVGRPHPALVLRRRPSSSGPPASFDGRVSRQRGAHPADPERRRGRLAACPSRPARRRLDRRRRV